MNRKRFDERAKLNSLLYDISEILEGGHVESAIEELNELSEHLNKIVKRIKPHLKSITELIEE